MATKRKKAARAATGGIAHDAVGFRSQLASMDGKTFGGRRDMYKALGRKRVLLPIDYRSRFKRNAVANRVVKALPKATWRGGAELVEDQDVQTDTVFEQAFKELDQRLKVWSVFQRADVLAGIGRYAIILIGAPGVLESPLDHVAGPDDIKYLMPFAEEDATISRYETNQEDPRFGLPLFYTLKRQTVANGNATNSAAFSANVHFSRVVHIADGLLDDNIFGEPRLECIWNLLDDLDKVTGGGAEAFWRRADQGIQFDLKPDMNIKDDQKKQLRQQIHEYEHDYRRFLLTRGVEVNTLGSDVADFSKPVDSIISQISTGTGIPQRILMGSEQAKLAGKSDRSNWDERVSDRRVDYAGPWVVRPFVDRLIALGALPEPDQYDVSWPQLKVMDDVERAEVALKWAQLNQPGLPIVVDPDEIRGSVLDLPSKKDAGVEDPPPAPAPAPSFPAPRGASAKGGAQPWKQVHQAADRFPAGDSESGEQGVRSGAEGDSADQPADGGQGQA
jgi:hypothetical protein